jgi:hypothetical protein
VAKTGTSATLQSVQRLPTLENLSIQDVELSAGVVDDVSLEVVLNKSGWKEPARQMLPVRYLRAGLQDLTFRVPRLGQVTISLDYAPADRGGAREEAERRGREAAARREAEERARAAAASEAEERRLRAEEAAKQAEEDAKQKREAAEAKRREAELAAQAAAKAAAEEEARRKAEAAKAAEEARAAAAAAQADEAKAKAEEAREAVRKKEEARQQRQREIEEARQAEEEILREQQRKKELRLEAEKRAAEIERNKAEAKAAEEEILREQQRKKQERIEAEKRAAEAEARVAAEKAEEEARLAKEKAAAEKAAAEKAAAEKAAAEKAAAEKAAAEKAAAEKAAAAKAAAEKEAAEKAAAAKAAAEKAAAEKAEEEVRVESELIDQAPPLAVRSVEDEEETAADDEGEEEEGEEEEGEEEEESEEEEGEEEESTAEEKEGEDDEDEEEDEDEDDDEPLAEMQGDLQVGCTLTIEVPISISEEAEAEGLTLQYGWHRCPTEPDDSAEWTPIGSTESRYVLTAEDVGCWLFGEWKLLGANGEASKEGATEASDECVRLMAEDRENLKAAILEGKAEYEVRTQDGPAKLCVTKQNISLKSRFGGTKVFDLSATVLSCDPEDPAGLLLATQKKPIACGLQKTEERDLLVLTSKAFSQLEGEASHEGKCKVWEGEGYGEYFGYLYGQVLLLYEGADAPEDKDGTEPSEALMLHGCKTEAVEEDGEDGPELSIADAGGEVFSLCFDDQKQRDDWKEAIDTRNDPPAIARASHILLKHNESRRMSSWRDPEGREIKRRTKQEAINLLKKYKKMIEEGKKDIATLAEAFSDCDTAKHGGDLGWFAAKYMQPEFEEAVLALRAPTDDEEGELSDIVETASGVHLIQRTG